MNLGRYEHYISSYGLVRVPALQVSQPKAEGTAWTLESNIPMTLRGVEVALGGSRRAHGLELSVSRNDVYHVALLSSGARVYETSIHQVMSGDSSLAVHTVRVPPDRAFDAVLITPSGGDARYALGHLRVLP
jgi:hypothetical protein